MFMRTKNPNCIPYVSRTKSFFISHTFSRTKSFAISNTFWGTKSCLVGFFSRRRNKPQSSIWRLGNKPQSDGWGIDGLGSRTGGANFSDQNVQGSTFRLALEILGWVPSSGKRTQVTKVRDRTFGREYFKSRKFRFETRVSFRLQYYAGGAMVCLPSSI